LAGIGELILFTVGLVLLILEVFVIPGFGIAGISGIVLIVASLFLSLVGRLPHPGDLETALLSMGGALAFAITGGFLAVKFLPRTTMYRRLVLDAAENAREGYLSSETNSDLAGKREQP
jgi:membrane-bound serine protease (ClpP class)